MIEPTAQEIHKFAELAFPERSCQRKNQKYIIHAQNLLYIYILIHQDYIAILLYTCHLNKH